MYLNENYEQYVLSCGLTIEAVDKTLENYHIKENYFKQLLWSLCFAVHDKLQVLRDQSLLLFIFAWRGSLRV